MTQENEYIFQKRLIEHCTGYRLECVKLFEQNGEKMEAIAVKHLYEADIDKEIPEIEKQELIAMIDKKIAQLS